MREPEKLYDKDNIRKFNEKLWLPREGFWTTAYIIGNMSPEYTELMSRTRILNG